MNDIRPFTPNQFSNSNSGFWLSPGFFDDDHDHFGNGVKKRGTDLLQLAGYRRAIANFVTIVTGQNIPVKFSTKGDSYTDGKQIVLSAKCDDKNFDPAVGLALHEGSHIKLTDFKFWTKFIDDVEINASAGCLEGTQYQSWEQQIIKDLLNWVEDRRIDNFIFTSAPGYKGYYHAMYNKYFHSKIVDKGLQSNEHTEEKWESYMFHIINFTNANRNLKALKGLRKVWGILDLKNINRLKGTKDALDVALAMFDEIKKYAKAPETKTKQPTEGKCQEGKSCQKGSGGKPKGHNSGGKTKDDGSKAKGGKAKKGSGGKYDLTPRQSQQLEKAFEKQKDFLKGNIKKKNLSKSDANQINTMENAGVSMKELNLELDNGWYKFNQKVKVMIVNKLTKELINSREFPRFLLDERADHYNDVCIKSNADTIAEGIVLGKMLGKKLKVRSEKRDTKFNRLENGKIDKRLLSGLGYGYKNVFHKIETFEYDPGVIHISIDNSGSMSGNKYKKALKTAVAIAKAASMTDNMDCVLSFRTACASRSTGNTLPVMLIGYDSRKDKFSKIPQLLKHVTTCGITPEGLCFDAIMDQLLGLSGTKDAYFLNMSDGMPMYSARGIHYNGSAALSHTKSQVKKLKDYGIKVLSYFIGDKYDSGGTMNNFRTMYGKDAEFINTERLVDLAKTMNNLFLKK